MTFPPENACVFFFVPCSCACSRTNGREQAPAKFCIGCGAKLVDRHRDVIRQGCYYQAQSPHPESTRPDLTYPHSTHPDSGCFPAHLSQTLPGQAFLCFVCAER